MLVDVTSNYENFKIIFHRYSVWHKNYLINVEDRYIYNKLWSSNSTLIKPKIFDKLNYDKAWMYIIAICTLKFSDMYYYIFIRNLIFNNLSTTVIQSIKYLYHKIMITCV